MEMSDNNKEKFFDGKIKGYIIPVILILLGIYITFQGIGLKSYQSLSASIKIQNILGVVVFCVGWVWAYKIDSKNSKNSKI